MRFGLLLEFLENVLRIDSSMTSGIFRTLEPKILDCLLSSLLKVLLIGLPVLLLASEFLDILILMLEVPLFWVKGLDELLRE